MTTGLIVAGGLLTAFFLLRPVLRKHTAGFFDDVGHWNARRRRRKEARRR